MTTAAAKCTTYDYCRCKKLMSAPTPHPTAEREPPPNSPFCCRRRMTAARPRSRPARNVAVQATPTSSSTSVQKLQKVQSLQRWNKRFPNASALAAAAAAEAAATNAVERRMHTSLASKHRVQSNRQRVRSNKHRVQSNKHQIQSSHGPSFLDYVLSPGLVPYRQNLPCLQGGNHTAKPPEISENKPRGQRPGRWLRPRVS